MQIVLPIDLNNGNTQTFENTMIVVHFSSQEVGAKWCVFVFKTETKNINAACYSMLIIANQSLLNKQNEEKINYLYQSALCVD